MGTIRMPILEMGKTDARNIFCHELCWSRTRILSLTLKVLYFSLSSETYIYMKNFHMQTSYQVVILGTRWYLILGGRDCIVYFFKNLQMLQITFYRF